MIRLGVRYAWLDVLCLRQALPPLDRPFWDTLRPQARAKDFVIPDHTELRKIREQCRLEEWKVDVPTIGAIYSGQGRYGLYVGGGSSFYEWTWTSLSG